MGLQVELSLQAWQKQGPTSPAVGATPTLLAVARLYAASNCAFASFALLQVSLVVATAEGLLYEYSIEELSSSTGPKCSLAGEWTLLGSTGLSSGV